MATEVFEHVDDRKMIRAMPAGMQLIFTVPTYGAKTHLRLYPSEQFIRLYYEDLLAFGKIVPVLTQGHLVIWVCSAVTLKDWS